MADVTLEMFGTSRQNFGGTLADFHELVHPEDLAALNLAWAEGTNGRGRVEMEYRIIRPDGGIRYLHDRGEVMYDHAGRPIYASGVVIDITEKKQAQEILDRQQAALYRAKEAAERASEVRAGSLAYVSHELRTPIQGVVGFVSLTLDTPLSAQQREYLKGAESSAHTLISLLNDILYFAKAETAKVQIETLVFNLREVAELCAKPSLPEAKRRNIKLTVEVDADLPEVLCGDPMRLQQVLVNLVSNAVKFTQSGDVSVKVELVRSERQAVMVRFQVRDSGIGIRPEKQARIFEAFNQADNSTTRRYGGTGLGLTIASQLVDLMGGRLWLSSEENKGSTFCFQVSLGLAPQTNGILR